MVSLIQSCFSYRLDSENACDIQYFIRTIFFKRVKVNFSPGISSSSIEMKLFLDHKLALVNTDR